MPNNQLTNYIKQSLQKGYSIEQIKATLISVGWKATDIDATILSLGDFIKSFTPVKEEIVPQSLSEYVKNLLIKGQNPVAIAEILRKVGWKESLIQKSLQEEQTKWNAVQSEIKTVPVVENKPSETAVQKTEEKVEVSKAVNFKEEAEIKAQKKANHLLNIIETFKETGKIFANNWLSIIIVQIIPTLISVFFSLIIKEVMSIGNIYLAVAVLSLSGLVFFYLVFWSQTALIKAISKVKPNIVEIYKESFTKVLPYLSSMVLVFLTVFTGFAIFFLPGILFLVWHSFTAFVVVLEDKKGFEAMAVSREYTRKNFMRVLGRGILLVIIMFTFGMLLGQVSAQFGSGSVIGIIWSVVERFIELILVSGALVFLFVTYDNIKTVQGPVSEPPKGVKWLFRIFAGIGCLGIIAIVAGVVVMLGQMISMLMKMMSAGDFSFTDIKTFVENVVEQNNENNNTDDFYIDEN